VNTYTALPEKNNLEKSMSEVLLSAIGVQRYKSDLCNSSVINFETNEQ